MDHGLTHTERVPLLRELNPAMVAALASNLLLTDATSKLAALNPELAQEFKLTLTLERSPFYRLVRTLVEYAQGAEMPEGMNLDRLLIGIAPLYRSARSVDTLPMDVESAEPSNMFGVAVMGALARHRLDRGSPLSCADLALLAGIGKDHLTALAAAGDVPGAFRDATISKHRPWRFRVTKTLRNWIDTHANE